MMDYGNVKNGRLTDIDWSKVETGSDQSKTVLYEHVSSNAKKCSTRVLYKLRQNITASEHY